eukprot:jgi/Botrbrau1/10118/Bobra.20_2s0025.1
MFCCGCREKEDLNDEPIASRRRTRDCLFLLIFTAFWGGMIFIAYKAFTTGDPKRLAYGIDSYGNVCGANNNWNGEGGPDLRQYKKLYYLNPLELLNSTTFRSARAICVQECPSSLDLCSVDSLPCRSANQYRCPYYRVAEMGLYGTMPGVDTWATSYWGNLVDTSLPGADCGIDLASVPSKFQGAFVDQNSPGCGSYLQLLSQYPGRGPCDPVLMETIDYFNRCIPKLSPELQQQLVSMVPHSDCARNQHAVAADGVPAGFRPAACDGTLETFRRVTSSS